MCNEGKKFRKLVAVVLAVFIVVPFFSFGIEKAQATGPTPVRGKAETMNTGDYYLDFDDTYHSNVVISDPDPGKGNLRTMSGWAWDYGFGWINFGDALHGGPVTVDYATGKLSGQAYVENTGGNIDFDNFNSNAYIDPTTGRFGGYGWGNDGGWYNFSNTGVYVAETGNPNVPASAQGYDSPAKKNEVQSGNWGSYTTPYFEWSGATDNPDSSGYASGIDGYWVYFGTTADANPTTAGAYQSASNFTAPSALASGVSYYLRIVSQDKVGNRSSASTLFTYGYDGNAPNSPDYINVSPVGCSTSSIFTFSWNEVTDPLSGTANYEYKTGSTGTVQTTNQLSVEAAPYQEGDNVFYVRTVDNAGNRSAWQTGVYCSTGLAYIIDGPTVAPGSSSITVSWVSDKNTTGYVRVHEGNDYVSEQGHADFTKSHKVKVIGLEPEREYRYKLIWLDSNGNLGESAWYGTNTTEAPQVYNLEAKAVSSDTVVVSWTTTEEARCTAEFGIGNYDNEIKIEGSGSSFSQVLSGLSGGTTYQFRVNAVSANDGTKFYSGRDFQTPPLPLISNLSFETSVENATPSVKVSWKTNVETTSSVFYRQSGESYKEVSSSEKKLAHEIDIEGLSDNSTYQLYVSGIDQFGNTTKSDIQTFSTPLDTRPPTITDIVVETSNIGIGKEDSAQAAISYSTDESAKCLIEYAEGINGDNYSNKTPNDDIMSNSHLSVISDLTPQTPYHFRIICSDKGNNETISSSQTIISGEVTQSVLSLILKTLNNLFGWLGRLEW